MAQLGIDTIIGKIICTITGKIIYKEILANIILRMRRWAWRETGLCERGMSTPAYMDFRMSSEGPD